MFSPCFSSGEAQAEDGKNVKEQVIFLPQNHDLLEIIGVV